MLDSNLIQRPQKLGIPPNFAPEYFYYFDTGKLDGETRLREIVGNRIQQNRTVLARLKRAFIAGFASLCIFFAVLSAPFAATTGIPRKQGTADEMVREHQGHGKDALRAQMNALNEGLDSLRRLRNFFDEAGGAEGSILERARQLIETLPQHENADDAAWRIAAIASLTLQSGTLANVDVNNDYRLPRGAMGWDLGPEGARVHTGFTPVTPTSLENSENSHAIPGINALSDGITALEKFQATLPNGIYRILIVRDNVPKPDEFTPPFGGEIHLNGAPIKSQISMARERIMLTGSDGTVAANQNPKPHRTALGIGVEGWAIVENGRLKIDFKDNSQDIAITTIIAEPIDIGTMTLREKVLETLADVLGNINPAAGPPLAIPPSSTSRPAMSNTSSRRSPVRPRSPQKRGTNKPPAGSIPSRTRFAASRVAAAASFVAAAPAPKPATVTTETAETPFEDREIFVSRSIGPEADTEGAAIDLGALLDDASPSGVFMCLADPCAETPPIAGEPDLVAAIDALGDWLSDPLNLPDDWAELATVLAGRAEGSEIAIVYEFDVDTELLTDVELRASAGTGLFIWLDGTYIFGASETGTFTDDLNFEYRLELPGLEGGRHFLQVLSESHEPDQGFALELRGTPLTVANVATVSVSEPGTLILLGLGLIGIAFSTRKKRFDA